MSSDEAEVRHQNAYMLASSCKWQLAVWPWPGGQSALTSRIWHSRQAAAKRKWPSSFVDRGTGHFTVPGSQPITIGLRTPACSRNGKSRAGLQYKAPSQKDHILRCQHVLLS